MPTKKGILKIEEINKLVDDFIAGRIDRYNVPIWLLEHITGKITQTVGNGFGYALDDIYNPYYETTRKAQKNLIRFSANKIVHNMNDMYIASKAVGKDQLKDTLFKVNDRYNRKWLETEIKTSFKMAEGARGWAEKSAEREMFPFLMYNAIIDDATRDEHAALNGIIRHINDSFWDEFFPPNGYNCRCSVDQLDEQDARARGGETDLREKPIDEERQRINPVFRHNPGKTGEIFKSTHPYMDRRKRVLNKRQQAVADDLIKQYTV